MARIQFLLKYREANYGGEMVGAETNTLSSGLLNSATFVADMLRSSGHDVDLSHCIDADFIDREVTRFRPSVVIIEAFWVTPEKLAELRPLHPNVKWIVRNHSATPFLANEGIVMDWSLRYMGVKNVYLSCNDPRTNEEFTTLIRHMTGWNDARAAARCIYLPNFYPTNHALQPRATGREDDLNIACFGAIRPLKNQLAQATAAIELAQQMEKGLNFHINGGRIENGGSPVIKSIRQVFEKFPSNIKLIEHNWTDHTSFLNLLATMDLSLQVSYTETFNIVTADAVSVGTPVVTSSEISWVDSMFWADPNSVSSIVQAAHRAIIASATERFFHYNPNLVGLTEISTKSKHAWLSLLG